MTHIASRCLVLGILGAVLGCTQIRVISQTCIPQVEVEVEVHQGGVPREGARAELIHPSAGTQVRTTNAEGRARFQGLPEATSFRLHAVIPGLTNEAWENRTCSTTPRHGFLAYHPYMLRLPPGSCHPNTMAYPASTCQPNGDLLPVGPNQVYQFGVFDTGATIVLINNSTAAGTADTQNLALCSPSARCPDPGNPPQPLIMVPPSLDVRLWGLGATVPPGNGLPTDAPQQEVPSIRVRPGPHSGTTPTLIGAPVAARTIALIDYGTTISRTYPWSPAPFVAPDITFFPSGSAAVPNAPFRFPLTHHGSFTTALGDSASVGPRFLMATAVFRHHSRTATGSTFRILFDTGNSSTQVTEAFAAALGLDLDEHDPIDTITQTTSSSETITMLGYMIHAFELTTDDGFYRYVLNNPMIFVRRNRPNGQNPFPDLVDAVIGANYFWKRRILFDGPGSALRLFGAHPIDSDGDGVADHSDNCRNVWNSNQQDRDKDGVGDTCDSP